MGYIILPIDELHHFSRWTKHVETTKQISMQSLPAKIDHASIRFFLAARPNGLFRRLVGLDYQRCALLNSTLANGVFRSVGGTPSYHPFLMRIFHGFSMKSTIQLCLGAPMKLESNPHGVEFYRGDRAANPSQASHLMLTRRNGEFQRNSCRMAPK